MADSTAQPESSGPSDSAATDASTTTSFMACAKCRQPLCFTSQLTSHEKFAGSFGHHKTTKQSHFARQKYASDKHASTASSIAGIDTKTCTSWWISEPLSWMRKQVGDGEIEGKLCCPKCAARVGSIKWAGAQCSCGTWIHPAIQIQKKCVDIRETTLPLKAE